MLVLDDGHRLEPSREADVASLAAHWSGPAVRRFLWDDREVTEVMAAAVVAESEATFKAGGYGLWLIRPPQPGRAILRPPQPGGALLRPPGPGRAILRPPEAGPPPTLSGVVGLRPCPWPGAPVELVYSLEPDRWGRGLATRAARAVLRHAFGALGLTAVAGGIDEGNDRSTRVLERLGLHPTGTASGFLGQIRYWVVTAEQWSG